MSVPTIKQIMDELPELFSDERGHRLEEIYSLVFAKFQISEEDTARLLPSGKEPDIKNRIRWAIFKLKHAGLLDREEHGTYRITQSGLKAQKHR